jgi:hypothetical protein
MEILIYIVSFWLGILAYYFLKLMYTIAFNSRYDGFKDTITNEWKDSCSKYKERTINDMSEDEKARYKSKVKYISKSL